MELAQNIWTWLSDTQIQKTLGFLGGGLVVIGAAVWSIFKYFFENRKSVKSKNHDNSNASTSVNIKINANSPTSVPEVATVEPLKLNDTPSLIHSAISYKQPSTIDASLAVEPLTPKAISKARNYKSYDADRPPSLDLWLGRESELSLVNDIEFGVIAITGIGGQGKSTFAAKVLEKKLSNKTDAFWDWRDCREQGERFPAQIASIIERLTCGSVKGNALAGYSEIEIVRYFFKLTRNLSGIIVFDNVDHYVNVDNQEFHGPLNVFVEEALRTQSRLTILLTCRPTISYPNINFREVPLKGLSYNESKELMRLKGIKAQLVDDDKIRRIHQLTKGHPFWLTLISTQIERHPDKADKIFRELELGQSEDRRIIAMLRPVWGNLSLKQKCILQTMSESLKTETEDRLWKVLREQLKTRNQLSRALKTLCAMSLLVKKSNGKGHYAFELHPLVRQFVKSEIPHNERRPYMQLLSNYCQQYVILIRCHDNQSCALAIDTYEYAAMNIEIELEARNYCAALKIANDISDAFLARGLGEEYLRLCAKILDTAEWSNGSLNSDDAFHSFSRGCLEVMGEYGHENDARNLIKTYDSFVPSGTSLYIAWCSAMCQFEWLMKNYKESIKWGEDGERLKASSDIDTSADTLHYLNLAKRDAGFINEALEYFSKGKDVKRLLEDNYLDDEYNAPFLGNIGRCLHLLGDSDTALKFYARSMDLLERGKKNSQTINNLGWASLWISQACSDLEMWDDALLFINRCHEIWKKRAPLHLPLITVVREKISQNAPKPSLHKIEPTEMLCRTRLQEWLMVSPQVEIQ